MTMTDPVATSGTPRNSASRPDLARFFRPRSIAVVGAHDTRAGLEGVTRKAMSHAERVGATFVPVNPTREQVFGVPCVPDLGALTGPIDVVVVLVGDVVGVADQAVRADLEVGFFLVFSNGFSELGTAAGSAREQELVAAMARTGARLVGPNTNANAWDPLADLPGKRLAVISQSGVQGRPLTQAQELGIALSYWAPTGNEADLEAADFMEFFVRDPETAAVCCYIEGFTSGPGLRRAAVAAIEERTPLVVVKVGRTDAGGAMAASHTGHLVGSDEVVDAFMEQHGVVRVDDFDELVQTGAALARLPLPTTDHVAICSVSGGTAAHVADLAVRAGISLPPLTTDTVDRLSALVGEGFRVDNPVDNGGTPLLRGHGPEIGRLCMDDEHIGAMLVPVPASTPGLTAAVVDMLVELAPTAGKPILPIWSGPSVQDPNYQRIWDAGLPVFSNVRNAIIALRALQRHPARNTPVQEFADLARRTTVPAARPGRVLDEAASTRFLSERGLPFARNEVVSSADAAVKAAESLGWPVVLKGLNAAHKSEQGLVRLDIHDERGVRESFQALADGGSPDVLVAEQISGGLELLIGLSSDPVFGPVILVGAGGVTAEAAPDVARAVLPLTRRTAAEMVDSLRVRPLLDGWRGAPALARENVVDLLMKVADLAATGEVYEMDVNPLTVLADRVVGLDALVRLAVSE